MPTLDGGRFHRRRTRSIDGPRPRALLAHGDGSSATRGSSSAGTVKRFPSTDTGWIRPSWCQNSRGEHGSWAARYRPDVSGSRTPATASACVDCTGKHSKALRRGAATSAPNRDGGRRNSLSTDVNPTETNGLSSADARATVTPGASACSRAETVASSRTTVARQPRRIASAGSRPSSLAPASVTTRRAPAMLLTNSRRKLEPRLLRGRRRVVDRCGGWDEPDAQAGER